MKILVWLSVIFVVTLIGVLGLSNTADPESVALNPETQPMIESVTINGKTFVVEVVDTPAARAQGLSGRDPLESDEGMLFIFDSARVYSFWMKDMKFSIDILWIYDGVVVDMWNHAPYPEPGEKPESYTPDSRAHMVLEVTAGFIDEYGVKVGDEVMLDTNHKN